MDVLLTHWINAGAGSRPVWDGVMIALTRYGVPLMVALVAVQWFGRPDRAHLRHVAVTAGLAVILGLALNQAVLLGLHRVRPYDAGVTHLIVPASTDWSFPSDHTSASFAIALAFLRQRLPLRCLGFFGLAALICLSRIYVGVHYVSDILGGIASALIAVMIVRVLYREGSRLDRLVTSVL